MTGKLVQSMLEYKVLRWGWLSFRRRDFNRLFCKSNVLVKYKI